MRSGKCRTWSPFVADVSQHQSGMSRDTTPGCLEPGHRAGEGDLLIGVDLYRLPMVRRQDLNQVAGRWTYLYRAIGQHGQVTDIWLSYRRDLAPARAFFTRALLLRQRRRGDHRPGACVPASPERASSIALHTTEQYAATGLRRSWPTQSQASHPCWACQMRCG